MPISDKHVLIPYDLSSPKAKLFCASELESRFPLIWKYLKQHEEELRAREKGKMDHDDSWWAYNYPKNLDKQGLPRLLVASTVPELRLLADEKGKFAQDDRRVFAVLPEQGDDLYFLLGILNSPVPNYLFKRIARPKANGFFDVDARYLAPLPIPKVIKDEKERIAHGAKKLQQLHTRRRDLLTMIDKRLGSAQCEDDTRDAGWLWADVKPVNAIKADAPSELNGRELSAWANFEHERRMVVHLDKINPMLRAGVQLSVEDEYGELKLLAGGIPMIEGVYLDDEEAGFIAAQWRHKARQTNVTEKFDAKRLVNLLLKLRKTNNEAIKKQIVKIDAEIQSLDVEIEKAEAEMNAYTYKLYKLTDEEIQLVENG